MIAIKLIKVQPNVFIQNPSPKNMQATKFDQIGEVQNKIVDSPKFINCVAVKNNIVDPLLKSALSIKNLNVFLSVQQVLSPVTFITFRLNIRTNIDLQYKSSKTGMCFNFFVTREAIAIVNDPIIAQIQGILCQYFSSSFSKTQTVWSQISFNFILVCFLIGYLLIN
ncbi:transmembrane protein, putative (macronuclear) [Tetrahymena thermophila SB210]|uniref:Transmembrane protein, putative n=1 Tax=Tetrahymena thermophila (strain SB210) TaxID=312017 RepID=W7XJ14_TETTS|nr:transmembrane protein, putative [Tetrahymena thermophila SB210]EWS75106.1 transmembrane protein, putative [Tetrahymena thermophila SB210]|eukprot:XP_012652344.1 transmembrane protein, putative [Tetrahymena thermophila SB210]